MTPIYGAAHRRLRRRWTPRVNRGVVKCARCGELIDPAGDAAELGCTPGQTWDLGHDDNTGDWSGPEHARRTSKHPACNRRTATYRAARARRPERKHPGLR